MRTKAVKPEDVRFKHFRADDDSVDMNIDGSSTPKVFKWVGVDRETFLYRVNFILADASPTALEFGGLSALVNGLEVKVYNAQDEVVIDFLDGDTIKNNLYFNALAGIDTNLLTGAGDDGVSVRWTLANGLGGPLLLKQGEYVGMTVQDDLTGITLFEVYGQGRKV